MASVTRLGDLLEFGQLFKPLATLTFAPISPILRQFLRVSKSFIFLVKPFLHLLYTFGDFLLVTLSMASVVASPV